MRGRIYEILEGDGVPSIWYGRVMTAVIIVSMIPLCFWDWNAVFDVTETVCITIFIADYVARWATADFKLGKGALSFILYPFTPMAIVDMLTMLPTFIAINPAWRTLRILRMLRALRAFRLFRYSKSVHAIVGAFQRGRGQLSVVLALALAYVLLCAMVMFNVEHDTFPTYFHALYWSVVSLTTVGYGDLYPTTDIGRTIAMFSSLAGIAIVALPSSIITAGLLEELKGGDGGNEVSEVEEDSAGR